MRTETLEMFWYYSKLGQEEVDQDNSLFQGWDILSRINRRVIVTPFSLIFKTFKLIKFPLIFSTSLTTMQSIPPTWTFQRLSESEKKYTNHSFSFWAMAADVSIIKKFKVHFVAWAFESTFIKGKAWGW